MTSQSTGKTGRTAREFNFAMAKRNADKGQVPTEAVSKTPDPKAAASQGVVPTGSGAEGNGSAAHQPELDFAAQSAAGGATLPAAGKAAAPASASAAPAGQPAADPIVVVELVNGVDGVWKKLSNGKRVDLTTKEWRQELARLFTRAPAP